jgi:hypothetical protein
MRKEYALMSEKQRVILQVGLVLLLLSIPFITGGDGNPAGCLMCLMWCLCSSMSNDATTGVDVFTYDQTLETTSGKVARWHDFSAPDGELDGKTLNAMRDWGPGHVVIGVQAPTAAGATEPGRLSNDPHEFALNYNPGNIRTNTPLVSDPARAEQIAALFPPSPNTQWQALVPANDNWADLIPTQTTNFSDVNGWLHYTLDFNGADSCNGCEVKVTVCSDFPTSLTAQGMMSALDVPGMRSNGQLICRDPLPTYIALHDNRFQLIPTDPIVAAFGFAGGLVFTSTNTSSISVPYLLEHNSAGAETFQLETIESEQGWSYSWADAGGASISQISVPAPPVPYYNWPPPNLRVKAEGLPTCSRLRDTIHLTATHVTTPTVQAKTSTIIQLLPDPGVCPVADVGISQIGSTAVISAGQHVTFTLTVANYEDHAVTAIVTDTLEPATAVGDVTLPTECDRTGGEIHCQIDNLPAGGQHELALVVRISASFAGEMTSTALADPLGAVDGNFYDNQAGPLRVDVQGLPWKKMHLPILKR